MAAETILQAHKAGDYSAKALEPCASRLRESFVWQDYDRYQGPTRMAETHPQFFSKYPYEFTKLARKLFSVAPADDGMQVPKRTLELAVADHVLAELGLMSPGLDLLDAGRAALL